MEQKQQQETIQVKVLLEGREEFRLFVNSIKSEETKRTYVTCLKKIHGNTWNKRSFDLLYQKKQANREYIERYIGTPYGDKNNTLIVDFKSRTKFTDQTLPLAQTMIDSFKFTDNR
jgi:hypothetical protein